MSRAFLVTLAAALTSLIQGSFMAALPHPWSAIDLPLILLLWLVVDFRFRESIVAAVIAGTIAGALSMMPVGTYLVAYVASAAFAGATFTRVLTGRSWPGLLSLQVVTYAFFQAILALFRLGRAVFGGWPLMTAFGGATVWSALAAVAAQLGAIAVLMLLVALGKRTLGRSFITRSRR